MYDYKPLAEKPEDLQAWFDTIIAKPDLSVEEHRAVVSLLGHPGLAAIISLMMATRQGAYVMLAALPLDTPAAVSRASAIQGQIRGIDTLPETLLNLLLPAQADTNGAKDQPYE